jgi:Protein of unknown function (DUF732)
MMVSRRPPSSTTLGSIALAVSVAIAALGGLSLVSLYFLRDKTAQAPARSTVTVTASAKPPPPVDTADGRFISTLTTYGISDNGTDAIRQRFMELGHYTCFVLLSPGPQPLDVTVNNILAEENQDSVAGGIRSPKFSHDDAEHLARAAITAYCPNAPT